MDRTLQMKYFKKLFLTALTICLIFGLANVSFAASISDLSDHWAKNQIGNWVDQGLASGYPDGTFKPDNEISRAEFVSLVNRSFSIQNSNEKCSFTDAKAEDWFYKDVAAAQIAGYIAGYEDKTFKPDQQISRQEVALIITRLLKLDTTGELTVLDKFADGESIPAWSQASLNAIVEKGIINGYPDETVKPFKAITRAEAIVCLNTAMNKRLPVADPVPVVTVKSGIEGKTSYNGNAVQGVTIKLFNKDGYQVIKETITDAEGTFKFETDPGVYDLTATTDKAVAYASEITVNQDKLVSQELALADATIVSGKLNGTNNKAVADVKIMFTTNPTFVTTTDKNGEYTLVLLPERKYTIRTVNPTNSKVEVLKENVDVGGSSQQQSISSLTASFNTGSSEQAGGGGGGGGTISGNDYPAITDASITIKEANGDSIIFRPSAITDGKCTIVIKGSEDATITGGTISVTEDATLTIKSPALIAQVEKPQELKAGSNKFGSIDLLGSSNLGFLYAIKSNVALKAELADSDGHISNIELQITIQISN